MILLGDAIEELQGVVAGGSCDRDTLIRYINRAQQYFHDAGEWWGSIVPACMDVCGECIRLPNEVETIRKIKVNGIPAPVHPRGFEYMPNAVQDLSSWTGCGTFLQDCGESPVICPVIPGGKIIVASTCIEEVGSAVEFRAIGMDGREIHDCCHGVGDVIQFGQVAKGIQAINFSTFAVQDIKAIRKERTKGYVFVIEHWADTGKYRVLAELHPDQTTSSHRVYQVAGGEGQSHELKMLVRRRFRRTVRDTDLLYMQSIPALKKAVDYIRFDDAGNSKEAFFARKEVLSLLGDNLFAKDGKDGMAEEAQPGFSISLGLVNIQ